MTPDGTAGEGVAEWVERARAWRAADPDPRTRDAITAVLRRAEPTELQALFGHELVFGTAGLRGPLGPGPARMNRLVVRRFAAALAAHLLACGGPTPRVVVGHDARNGSHDFGDDLVRVLGAAGVATDRFDEAVPTPLVAFAVRELGADAGVMVTASHNPAGDNGLKVYAADGAQIVAPIDAELATLMADLPLAPAPDLDGAPGAGGHLGGPSTGGALVEAYLRRAASLVPTPTPARTAGEAGVPLRIARTSLHGVGGALCTLVLELAGDVEVAVVAGQERPDPDFPTVRVPNPEEPGVLDALLRHASDVDAEVALALDPDADRLAVALPGRDGRWRALTGDELGALLTAHLLETSEGPDRLVSSTVVSSRLVPAMCRAAGVHHAETLTGFKWLCRPGIAHPEWRQLLAYEEALGYAVGADVRDKDGMTAALVVVHALGRWRRRGRAGADVLDDLARRHGAHVVDNGSLRAGDDPAAVERLRARVLGLAERPPDVLGGRAVVHRDRPGPDVLRWYLDDDTRVVLRPSGTEPKVKHYLEAVRAVRGRGARDDVDAARAAATAALVDVRADLLGLLG